MVYCIGIDVGASTTKAVILDDNAKILGHSVIHSGADFGAAAKNVLRKASAGLKKEYLDRGLVISTGYGRRNVPFAELTRTEISCHAKGSFHFFQRAHTLIDIGGQDSKIVKIDDTGKRTGFKMNRKCAAGTGAFLEEIANRLKIKIEKLNGLAEKATKNVTIGSYCTVFTATEILTKIRQNVRVEDIIKGIFESVIKRALEMDPLDGNIAMSGGVVAHNPYFVKICEQKLGRDIFVPPFPQLIGALGAALFALETKGGKHA
jgi:predicted CoA-substrate-specific enzyme activase